MELKDQVVSLELAKRLKALGVKQESLSYWLIDKCGSNNIMVAYLGYDKKRINFYKEDEDHDIYSAFSVAELGEILPLNCQTHKSIDNKNEWCGFYGGNDLIYRAKTEADCRAKMLIYLIEKGLVPAIKS